jgi:transcription antitermination factor NusG
LSEGQRWFVIQTLARRESVASFQLEAQGFRIYSPRLRRTVRHARKLRETIAPLFPGYIFVVLDTKRDCWSSINGTFGVARLLCAQRCPIPVPTGVVEMLIAKGDDAGLLLVDAGLRPGQSVSIVNGPFAQSLGVLERLDGKGRVRVLLTIMGGPVSVAMDGTNLTAA